MPSKSRDLSALRRLIRELERVLKAGPVPKTVDARVAELFRSIFALTDDLIERTPAAILGARGGTKTAERARVHYRQIAAMRKTKGGGRPRKIEH